MYSPEDLSTSLARFKTPGKWRDLPAEFERQEAQKRSFKIRMLAAAVAIGVIILGGIWALTENPAKKEVFASDSKDKRILLQLDNGKIIDLSANKGKIPTSSVVLDNSDETLSYSKSAGAATGMNKLTVPVGMDYKIVLADGSKVWLNAATRIEFPFSFNGKTREVKINGEAYLEIEKNPAKPFIVHLPHSRVNVLGTAFNINTYDSTVEKVSLVNGSIKMASSKNEVIVSPGNEAVLHANDRITERPFNMRHTLSWREGLFYFQKATLEEISRVLPRWYGIQVKIDNSKVLSRRFTGVIVKNDPIEIFMDDIKGMSGIDGYIDKDGVLHFR
jgi:transmembrane sensor